MLELIGAALCVIGLGYLVLLLRSYEYLSVAELKREARRGNKRARAVYSVRGVYGVHVFILIWALIGVLSSSFVTLMEGQLWAGFVIIIASFVTIAIHAVLPWVRYPSPSLRLASMSAPVITRILRLTRPLLRFVEKLTGNWIRHGETKRINSREELVEIIEHSRISDDPFSKEELTIAVNALTFSERKITEIMTPRSVVKYVRADDVLSPVMLSELHESGFSRFPVTEPERGDYIGILYIKDVIDMRHNHAVKDVMRNDVNYVNEFSSLANVLSAFLKSQHHLFFVTNEFEEVVGVVTIEDVLEQIIGQNIVDEFDQYSDLRAVARQLNQEHREKTVTTEPGH